MKQLFRVLLFAFLCLGCHSEKKKIDPSQTILGNWVLGTNQTHVLEIGKDSIYHKDQKFYMSYRIFSDSIEIKTKKFASTDKFELKFIGNDTLVFNGLDGENIYVRIK